MWLYMLFLVLGIVLGMTDKIPERVVYRSTGFQLWSLIFILFVMGVGIGSNEEIVESFVSIGLHSVIFAVAAIAGSLALVRLFRPAIQHKKEEAS